MSRDRGTTRERLEYQERLSDRADQILDAAIARGEPFTEGLSTWAVEEALREIGHPLWFQSWSI
jgi:hypothetical protein